MADQQMKVGVIGRTGYGEWGHSLGNTFAFHPTTKVVAVADEDKTGRNKAANLLEAENQYEHFSDMLDKERLDIVTIAPRWPDQRREMFLASAAAGVKGIFCEKPFAQTLADADEMLDACQKSGTRVVVAHRRAAGHEQHLKKLVKEGIIGDIQVLRGHGKADHRAGSLDLMILGTHILDGMRYVINSDVVWAHGHVSQDHRAIKKEDIYQGDEGVGLLAGNRVAAYYQFENGLTAHYESFQGFPTDKTDHTRHLGFEVYGTKGILSVRNSPGGELYLSHHDLWVPDSINRPWERIRLPEWEKEKDPTLKSNLLIVTELVSAITEDRDIKEVSSGADSRATLEMIMAVHESNRLGKRVNFPLENRHNPYASWLAEA